MDYHVKLIALRHVIKYHEVSRNHKQLHDSEHLIERILILDHRLTSVYLATDFALSMCKLVILLLRCILLHEVEVKEMLLHQLDVLLCLQV